MGMIRYSVDGNIFTIDGPGVELIDSESAGMDARTIVLQFLDSLDAPEVDRLVLERMGLGSETPVEMTIALLREYVSGAG